MSDCCTTTQDQQTPKRHACPENDQEYIKVPYQTILHHLKEPWNVALEEKAYYFCDDSECDVVYFGLDDTKIVKNQLRTKIGIKEASDDSLICYCFGVSKHEAKSNQQAKEFVIEKTKQKLCECNTLNPSGRCCLKDF